MSIIDEAVNKEMSGNSMSKTVDALHVCLSSIMDDIKVMYPDIHDRVMKKRARILEIHSAMHKDSINTK